MMPPQEPTFDWAETAEGITVRFPAPTAKQNSLGCAIAFVVAAAVLALPMPIIILWRLIDDTPTDAMLWVVYGIVVIVTGLLLRYAMAALREARLPPRVVQPSVLSVKNGILKIERAGRKRDIDYSWQLSEIADLCLSVPAPNGIFLTPELLVHQALSPKEEIRLSVERHSGEVDDVMIVAPGRYWAEVLEVRLRAYLGVSPAASTVTETNDGIQPKPEEINRV